MTIEGWKRREGKEGKRGSGRKKRAPTRGAKRPTPPGAGKTFPRSGASIAAEVTATAAPIRVRYLGYENPSTRTDFNWDEVRRIRGHVDLLVLNTAQLDSVPRIYSPGRSDKGSLLELFLRLSTPRYSGHHRRRQQGPPPRL